MFTFDYEAMNTKLDLLICGGDSDYARSAAYECYERLGNLESLLSMYREGSDINMVNTSPVGTVTVLSEFACDCLLQAFAVSAITGGAVDVCLGKYFAGRKEGVKVPARERGMFEFDPDSYCIKKTSEGWIDLGCIGKGFAVDSLVELLRDPWEIQSAFINFGGSSTYAFGKPEDSDNWKVNLSPEVSIDIPACGLGVGASGTSVLGEHIVDARTGEVPKNAPFRTWAFAESAAVADALSTAFMILEKEKIREICAQYPVAAALQPSDGAEIEFIGKIPDSAADSR